MNYLLYIYDEDGEFWDCHCSLETCDRHEALREARYIVSQFCGRTKWEIREE